MLQLRAKGRMIVVKGRATLAARCPLCGREHRYDKGPVGGPEANEVAEQGYSDEWLPCQYDLPGNFWRLLIVAGRKKRPPARGQPVPAAVGGQ